MDLTFGARLRLQRERQQVALSAIAEQTKIRVSLLEGLERDDVSHWPAGVFRRSYFRSYVQAIGLEPDATLREFLELHPDWAEEIVPTEPGATGAGGESARRRPPTRLRFLIGSAIGALPTRRSAPAMRDVAHERVSRADIEELREHRSPPVESEPVPAPTPVPAVQSVAAVTPDERAPDVDLPALAHLCTRLARVAELHEVGPVFKDAAQLLDAVGLILWMWDPQANALRAVLSHGYSADVLAQLPPVLRDADTAITAAFRSAETRVVNGSALETGAVVVPLTTPMMCAGVLALELRHGGERREAVLAFAAILAAQLSTLVGYPTLAPVAIG